MAGWVNSGRGPSPDSGGSQQQRDAVPYGYAAPGSSPVPGLSTAPSPLPDLRVFGDDPDTVHSAAVMFQLRGNAPMAPALFERLESLVRPATEARPDDRRLAEQLADCLNNLGNLFTATGSPDRAVRALEELEGIYRRLSPPGPSILVADVLIRRATAQAARGFWASAPVDLDAAVALHRELAAPGDIALQAELARVLCATPRSCRPAATRISRPARPIKRSASTYGSSDRPICAPTSA